MNERVMPKGHISSKSTKVHGIRRKDLKGCPSWPEIEGGVRYLLTGRPVVIYNAKFDVRLLDQKAAKWDLEPFDVDAFCAMLAYVEHRAVPHQWRKNDFKWHKLVEACRYEGIDTSRGHSALADAEMTRQLVWRLINSVGEMSLPQAA